MTGFPSRRNLDRAFLTQVFLFATATTACSCAVRRQTLHRGAPPTRIAGDSTRSTPAGPLPAYPDILRAAEIDGDLRVRFVIDSSGRAVAGSLVTVHASHELFALAMTHAFREWVQNGPPAGIGRAAGFHEEIFDFRAPHEVAFEPREIAVVSRDTTEDGVPHTVIGLPPGDSAFSHAFSATELLAAQRSALAKIADTLIGRDSSRAGAAALCVSVRRDGATIPADAETLRALSRPARRAVVPRACPRTYVTMIHTDERPPAGWVDPYTLSVTNAEGWNWNLVRVIVTLHWSTRTDVLHCRVHHEQSVWRAVCAEWSSRMS